ncbi:MULTISPECIES: DUF1217 domain-containing protein [Alphaproteobacteria]|uniref:Flagella associated protein n=2 Tax=Alphaproteobacteria TaxID=28211 RepID=A0A512HF44_9HYPH|nr:MULTISPECIES: DUF1217 domain-containing protein [Alphaproteobacteria]GEO84083.1 flagella associated protein [Ciceribacter naphthalenivorans]GLR24619.1 flagella associated protein [Ciceribacter naphthalenivorans]GLT07475.1 flagella associated protein [Sphingomonas psychrolutea]
MVSTYLSYDLVVRDMKATLNRTASDAQVSREAAYYEANIDKVSSVDEFLDDYRLYSYAMKAHGLEDMIYAKAFMKKVLESDLTDQDSYANKLTDDRYRNFATAYQFNTAASDAQSDAQETAVFNLYSQAQLDETTSIKEATAYYQSVIDNVTSAEQLVSTNTLFGYILDAYGIDRTYYSDDHFVQVLTSDVSDPNSYVNQLVAIDAASDNDYNSAAFLTLAKAFSFNTDGSVSGTSSQTDAQKEATISAYVEANTTYASEYTLEREQAYYTGKIATISTVDEITGDDRLFEYVKAAFQLDSNLLRSEFYNIVTSDLGDPTNYAAMNGGSAWTSVAAMFNFGTDGTVKSGMTAQDETQLAITQSAYANHYDDADAEDMATLLDYYSNTLTDITSVGDLLDDSSIRAILFKAFGIEEGEYSDAQLKKALTSDLTDPKSYANKSRDQRLINLASAFNFDGDGEAEPPLLAQNEITITTIAKAYIVNEIRYLKDPELKTAKADAQAEAEYYQKNIIGITSAAELLADRRLVDVVLAAKGFDPKEVTDDFLKQIFQSDLSDKKSFVNKQDDERWAELLSSFNFDSKGLLTRDAVGTVQQRGAVLETQNLYLHQMLEEDQGNSNAGVRLALYFERVAPTLTDAYDLLGDDALLETFRVTFGFSSDFSNMDIDMQASLVEKNLKLSDMQDPEKLKKFLHRFTAMYDSENGDYSSSALSVLSGGSASISADLLLSIATLKS